MLNDTLTVLTNDVIRRKLISIEGTNNKARCLRLTDNILLLYSYETLIAVYVEDERVCYKVNTDKITKTSSKHYRIFKEIFVPDNSTEEEF